MESDILNVLKFEMGNPTTKTFLRMFIRSAQEDNKKVHKTVMHPSDLLHFNNAI